MRALRLLAAAISLSWAMVVASAEPSEGVDYALVQSPVRAGGKIEVVEYFWFGCPICDELEPRLSAWAAKLPRDVRLRRVPAVWRDNWRPAAAIHFALASLGQAERLHSRLFEAVHLYGIEATDQAGLVAWLGEQGIDRRRLSAALRSPRLTERMADARRQQEALAVRRTPTLVVDGHYRTSMAYVDTYDELFDIVDGLIAKARARRAAEKAQGKP